MGVGGITLALPRASPPAVNSICDAPQTTNYFRGATCERNITVSLSSSLSSPFVDSHPIRTLCCYVPLALAL